MNWREAFFAQARSDNEVRKILEVGELEYSHQLHYLQMTTEKLAKGLLTDSDQSDPPELSHVAFVKCLQVIKNNPGIRRRLGYDSARVFSQHINSLLPLADQIEKLAPGAATGVRATEPNAEYPWKPFGGGPNDVIAPCKHEFTELLPTSPKIVQLILLVENLLQLNL